LKAFGNIKVMDSVLTWDGWPLPQVVEKDGKRVELLPNARRPEWPEADFIVGNPPFIGAQEIRERQGDLYAGTLWKVHKHVNASADFVMYWWDRAADVLSRKGSLTRRFGFVTTNSITQEFSRRVIRMRMEGKTPVSLLMAIPDHPWTKADRDAAAVRIAMTVAAVGLHEGVLRAVINESGLDTDQPMIALHERRGRINPDLTVGVDVTMAEPLLANLRIGGRGIQLIGEGFLVTESEAELLGRSRRPGLSAHIRPYWNGRDLSATPRGAMAIDFFACAVDRVRQHYLRRTSTALKTVKPERDRNNRASYRDNGGNMREKHVGHSKRHRWLPQYIALSRTGRHRHLYFSHQIFCRILN
jgi:hypothetical protein